MKKKDSSIERFMWPQTELHQSSVVLDRHKNQLEKEVQRAELSNR